MAGIIVYYSHTRILGPGVEAVLSRHKRSVIPRSVLRFYATKQIHIFGHLAMHGNLLIRFGFVGVAEVLPAIMHPMEKNVLLVTSHAVVICSMKVIYCGWAGISGLRGEIRNVFFFFCLIFFSCNVANAPAYRIDVRQASPIRNSIISVNDSYWSSARH